MGLTISYTLSTRRKPAETLLLQMVERTAEFARKIGCAEVHGPNFGGPSHWKMWKLPDGATTGEPISPLEGCSVSVLPGEGCEHAEFGLCRYPGVKGFKLSSCCKTQYAARHGAQHFIDSHRRVISLLDLWKDFGVEADVCDEGEYWETRSVEQLSRRVGLYDHLVAGVAGALKDASETQGLAPLKAEILSDARFEKLEAEGRREFAVQIEQLQKELRNIK